MRKIQSLTLTFSILICTIFQNCKDDNGESSKENKDIVNTTKQVKSDEGIIDDIINRYAKQLSNSDIKIVDSISCAQMEINRENYDRGTATYGYYSIKSNLLKGKIAGDLNGDMRTDYIANYSCENCYGGNGNGNYLSNCFFITSKENELIVNEEMTVDFKQKFIDEIKKDFGNPYFDKAQKEIMINGIEFTKVKNQIAYGTFNINTEACQGSPFPCVDGTFEYDANNRTLKMLAKITVEDDEE